MNDFGSIFRVRRGVAKCVNG